MAEISTGSVLMYAPRVEGGGMETHIANLSLALRGNGVSVTLIVCQMFGITHGRRQVLAQSGVELIDLPSTAARTGPIYTLHVIWFLLKKLRKRRFDCVVCHGLARSHHLIRIIATYRRFIWHDHLSGSIGRTNSETFTEPLHEEYPKALKELAREADLIITGSEQARRNLRSIQRLGNTIVALPPLRHLCEVNGCNEVLPKINGIRCGVFGTLNEQKGTGPLLRLWRRPELADITLVLFGHDASGRYEGLAKELGVRNIEFRGPYYEPDLPELVQDVHFALIPSLIEGYPIVAIELMANGLPFVTTRVGAAETFSRGSKEIIVSGFSENEIIVAIREMADRVLLGTISRSRLRGHYRSVIDYDTISRAYLSALLGAGKDFRIAPRSLV